MIGENGDGAVSENKESIPAAGDQHEIVELIRRAEAGEQEAMREVRALANTRLAGLWGEYGDLARAAERTLTSVAAGENVLMKEAIGRRMETMRSELLGPSTSPLERLLVERVVLCWLQVHYEDTADAAGLTKGTTWTQALNRQKRLESAHRRYLAAIKALATVRRLALPVLQVNIAEKQINVGPRPGLCSG